MSKRIKLNDGAAAFPVVGATTRGKQRIKQTSFESLPNELLVDVLGFLGSSSLNTMALVNRKFSILIDQTLKLTDHLPLKMHQPITRKMLPKGTRRYREIRIASFDVWHVYMKKFLSKVGSDVSRLSMRNCSLHGKNVAEVLSCFPKLDSCNFENCNITRNEELAMFYLPQLRVLKLVDSELLQHFVAHQLVEVELQPRSENDWTNLVNFLSNQTKLKKLKINEAMNFPENLVLKPLQKELMLDTFELSFSARTRVELVFEFILIFEGNVKDLEIKGRNVERSHLIYMELLSFKDLTGCHIEMENLSTDLSFYKACKINRAMKNLRIVANEFNNPACFHGLLRIYPAVEHLKLQLTTLGREITSADLTCIDELVNLKTFTLHYTPRVNVNGLVNVAVFRNISNLIVDSGFVQYPVDWVALYGSSPNLSQLTATHMTSRELKEIILNFKNLTHLTLGPAFFMTEENLQLLKVFGTKLEHFTLRGKRCWGSRATKRSFLNLFGRQPLRISVLAE